jgi:hypothetical protein
MHTIHLELEEELAAKLTPYRDKLSEILDLGLQAIQERETKERYQARERVLAALKDSSDVNVPRPPSGKGPYLRHPPVQTVGQPVSEIAIAQRGALYDTKDGHTNPNAHL